MKFLSVAVLFVMAMTYASAGIIASPLWGGHLGLVAAPHSVVTAAAVPPAVLATHGATIVTPSAAAVAVTPVRPVIVGLGLHHPW